MLYPQIARITQDLDDTQVENIRQTIHDQFAQEKILSPILPGQSVAITAGSRGIANIEEILGAIVSEIKEVGGEPFLVPAMGSHGGAEAEGQRRVLEEYGLTEEKIGVPIVSSMDTDLIGETEEGIPIYIDQHAARADHIVLVNRIKPHTEFHGCIESGLIKMAVIGMGKHRGALIAHKYAVKYGYEKTLVEIGRCILKNAPVAFGVGIVENGFGQTALIEAIKNEDIFEREPDLLEISRRKTPKLPFDNLDVLIVNECGKEISGTGMDTKVIGRIMNIYEKELTTPKITRIVLRDLTEITHGNAIGVGLADFVTKKVAEKVDSRVTGVNSVTAVTPEKGRMPIVCENDREALDQALATAGPVDSETVRLVWIKNTSKLHKMFISSALLTEIQDNTS
jgi:hypothetical protein